MRMPPLRQLYHSYAGSTLPDILEVINLKKTFSTQLFFPECFIKLGLAAKFVSLFRVRKSIKPMGNCGGNPNLFVKSGNS